jgi:hypothetical protein
MNSKMADHHLARQACIYIRQSTPGPGAHAEFNQFDDACWTSLKFIPWLDDIVVTTQDLGRDRGLRDGHTVHRVATLRQYARCQSKTSRKSNRRGRPAPTPTRR